MDKIQVLTNYGNGEAVVALEVYQKEADKLPDENYRVMISWCSKKRKWAFVFINKTGALEVVHEPHEIDEYIDQLIGIRNLFKDPAHFYN